MPRYFIHTDDGDTRQGDAEGYDLPGPRAAHDLALTALADMAQDKRLAGEHRPFTITVEDGNGTVLYSATLELRGRWNR